MAPNYWQHLGKRLREARQKKSVTQEECARALRISQPGYARYETGQRPIPVDALGTIAGHLGCDFGWLGTGDGDPFPEAVITRTGDDFELPVTESAAADETQGEIALDEVLTGESYQWPPGQELVKVRGDSMAALAYDGQWVVIAPESRPPRNGDPVVVWHKRRGLLFKRFYGEADRSVIILTSDNPVHRVPPLRLMRSDCLQMRVVVGVIHE